jgi:hypothetical protein
VAAVASARTPHRDATAEVLKWIGSADGVRPIAEGGYAFPAVTAAQPAFVDHWRKQGADPQPFLDAASGTTFPAPVGPRVGAGGTAYTPILQQVFLGPLRLPAAAPGADRPFPDIRLHEGLAIVPLLALGVVLGLAPRFVLDVIEPASRVVLELLAR